VRIISLIAGIFLVIATFTPAIIKNITFDTGPVVSSGNLYNLYALYVVLFIVLAIVLLVDFYRRSYGTQKLRVRLVLLSLSTSAIVAILTNLILPRVSNNLFLVNTMPRMGSIISLLSFSAISFYAILRHRFLDIRLALRAFIARFLMALICSFVLLGAVLAYDFFFPDPNLNLTLIVFIVFLVSVVISSAFDFVYSLLIKATDAFLFQNTYQPGELIRDLGKKMGETISLPIIKEMIESTLVTAFKPAFVRLVLWGANEEIAPIIKATLRAEDDTLVLDELLAEESLDQELISALQSLAAAVILPLSTKKSFLGMLILGEKKSSEAYSSNDLSVLETISYSAGVALENAYLYQESLDFNQKLKEEVHKATDDLQGAYDRLKELDRAKDDFLSIASHELRTPMTNIKNFLWMMNTAKGGELSDQKKDYVARAQKSVERMLTLINDMLDVSRIDQNRLELHPINVDLYKLILDIIEEFKPRVEAKGLFIKFLEDSRQMKEGSKLSVIRPLVVRADEDKLREVIVNLIGNSVKFTPNGGITVSLDDLESGQVKISITDTGKGIDTADLPKLFHKFSRIDSSYKTVAESGGTGLGLYISKSLTERMGGIIGVSSTIGQGSTFWVTLPRVGMTN